MADDVEVKFGAQTANLQSGINQAKTSVSGFSDDVLKLNPQLVEALNGLNKTAEGANVLSHATAGVTREFLVLGHEALTGNFSRLAGSSLVLANRMGVLQNIIKGVTLESVGWTAAIAAVVAGIYEWIAADERLSQTENAIRGAMELNNQSLSYNKEIVEQNIERLRILADVSASTASDIGIAFARAGSLSVDLKNNLIGMVGDYAAATGKDAPKAAEELIKMFSDPKRGAEELAHTFTGVLTPAQLQAIEQFSESGKVLQAQGALFDALGTKIDDFRINHLTFLQKELESLRDQWVATFSGHLKLDTSSLEAAFHDIKQRSPRLPSDQQDSAAAQESQNQLNVALEKGYEIERRDGLLVARKNELLEKQAGLLAAANAAGQTGDTSAQQRFLADAQEVQAQIDSLRAKGAKQDISAAMEAMQAQVEIEKIGLQQKRDLLQAGVDAGIISKGKEFAALKSLIDQEYAIELQELNDEMKIGGMSVTEKQRVFDEILKLKAQHEKDMAALEVQEAVAVKKSTDSQIQAYRQVFDEIGGKFETIFNGILQGTQTWQQATRRAAGDVAAIMIETAAKVAAAWSLSKLFNAAGWKEMAQAVMPKGGGIVGAITGSGGGAEATAEVANTTALTTLNAQLIALNAALGINTTSTEIAGTQTAAATAENTIATVGNTIAVDALKVVEAIKGFMGFDVGTWSVPSTGAALIHQGEIILPPGVSQAVRSGSMQIGNVGGAAGGGSQGNFTVNINAIDTQTGAQFLKQNAAVIAATMAGQMRNFNPSLRT